MIKGTDISAVQGVLSDAIWQALSDQGIRFAIMRAVVGNETWTDGAAVENAKRAKAHGIVPSPYVFPYPLPHLDPIGQAEMFVRKLASLGTNFDELPPALDCEWPPREEWKVIDDVKTLTYPWQKWGCSPSQLRDWIMRCLTRCEELTGCTWLVYTYRYWLKCIEAEKIPELGMRPLWLADYTYAGRWPSDAELARLKPPAPWSHITIVQHDGNGGLKLPGGKDADFNCALDEAEFEALTSMRTAHATVADDPVIDLELARHRAMGAMIEDDIARYRRERIDEAA